MKREEIINELKNRGYNAQPQDVVKNGVMKEGIILRIKSNIAPTVYVNDFNQGACESFSVNRY